MIIDTLNLINQGKVRDLYDLGDFLLLVTTDRISIFDVILPNTIPNKGKVLTRLSKFWFQKLEDIIPNHFITDKIEEMPSSVHPHKKILSERSMLVKKATPFPVECIVRGYLTGSGFREYQKTGSICGISLPNGLLDSSLLPEPIFTPSTKADVGEHDENITFEKMIALIGEEKAKYLKKKSIELYLTGAEIALKKGIIIADTKFEFGEINGEIILIDEVLTPDSSRFWAKEKYQVGRVQDSFDKQYVRDAYTKAGWNKKSPVPAIPKEVIQKTSEKYHTLEKIIIF